MLMTKEHYELLASFEREHGHRRLDREKDKENWKRGYVYQDGHVNELFLAYRKGYALGTVSGDAANRLSSAPVAIMDTRDALGLCAPNEDDFPALYALKGRRVALVDLRSCGPTCAVAGCVNARLRAEVESWAQQASDRTQDAIDLVAAERERIADLVRDTYQYHLTIDSMCEAIRAKA